MKIIAETNLSDFKFWSGAKETVEELTTEDLDTIEAFFEDAYPDGMKDTEINDTFWFQRDYIASLLGYEDWDELLEERHSTQSEIDLDESK